MIRCRRQNQGDEALRDRMRDPAGERRRFGYRRGHILLRQEGPVVNRKRMQRVCREEELSVRKRRGRKTAVGTRAPILVEAVANARWSTPRSRARGRHGSSRER